MRFILFFLGFCLLLSGCSSVKQNSKESKIIEIDAYKAEDIPFEDGSGRATIVYEKPGSVNDDGLFDVIVLAKGLDPEGKYEILLRGDNGTGVTFGPEANIVMRFGSMAGETIFQPNEQGELYVSMKNPLRIVSSVNEVRVVVTKNEKVTLKTTPFTLTKKGD